MYNQILIGYTDISGRQCTTFWCSQDQDAGAAAAFEALAAAVQACTDAAVTSVQFQATLILEATPSEGPYNTVWDRCAVLSKITDTGAPLTLAIVAPKEDIFEGDHVTLDLSNDDVVALQGEMMAVVGDKLGNPMGPFRRGYRTEAKGGL